ncbi:MAG: hypothetical protein WC421_04460 [Elusimicrobiales bacterium]
MLFSASCAYAMRDPFADFAQNVTADNIKPFTADLGFLMSSAINHTGRSLGIAGFDVGTHVAMITRPRAANTIPDTTGLCAIYVPVIQGEIGMPLGFDGFIRGFSWEGFAVTGGGIKWGFSTSDRPHSFRGLVYAAGHVGIHEGFSVTNAVAGIAGSVQGEAVEPFFSAALSRTELTVKEASAQPGLIGSQTAVIQPVCAAGLNFKPWRFMYLSAAANIVPSKIGMEYTLGIRF